MDEKRISGCVCEAYVDAKLGLVSGGIEIEFTRQKNNVIDVFGTAKRCMAEP